jgi:hypothetical protein
MVGNMAKQLVASDLKLTCVDAHKHAKRHGKTLASLPLLDEGIAKRTFEKATHYECNWCTVREILAYPASGEVFKKNGDIVDPVTGTRVPLSDLMRLLDGRDIYKPGIGLFIDPEGLNTHRKTGRTVVIPKSVIVLGNEKNPFIQESKEWVMGKPDEQTRIPLAGSLEELQRIILSRSREERWLSRDSQQRVSFLAYAGFILGYGSRHGVYAAPAPPFSEYGVAFEEVAAARPAAIGE